MKAVIPDFLVMTNKGLYCATGDFYLDPNSAVKTAIISHGHGDHACRNNLMVYSTPPTKAFMLSRYGKSAGHEFIVFDYFEQFEVSGVKVTFISAGHILGSAQILLEYLGIRYLYTGDYKIQPDSTCMPIDYVQADVLITESTFADPAIRHPDAREEIKKLNNCNDNILLGAYGLGKAQRLNYLINEYCSDKVVHLHYSILPIHKIYEQYGIGFLRYRPYERKALKNAREDQIYIVPPLTFNSYFRGVNLKKVFASGWEHLQRNNDLSLYISDHVDWNEILNYVRQVEPLEIWTLHGNGKALEEHFNGKIPVKILN